MTASEWYQRQMHYDILHHRKRLAWLQAKRKAEGQLFDLDHELLEQRERFLANPLAGSRSVDLNDAKRLAELDAFEAEMNNTGNQLEKEDENETSGASRAGDSLANRHQHEAERHSPDTLDDGQRAIRADHAARGV